MAVETAPIRAVLVTTGATVFTGAEVTDAVVIDHIVTAPEVFVWVTANEMKRPTSPATGV